MEFNIITKWLGIAFLAFIVYKTEFYKPIFKKVSDWVGLLFGFGNKSIIEVKADKVRAKAINKMLKRNKFKGEV